MFVSTLSIPVVPAKYKYLPLISILVIASILPSDSNVLDNKYEPGASATL